MDFLNNDQVSLANIRNILIRLEVIKLIIIHIISPFSHFDAQDTIIYSMLERSIYKKNDCIYKDGEFSFKNGYKGSFLSYMLQDVERLHGM